MSEVQSGTNGRYRGDDAGSGGGRGVVQWGMVNGWWSEARRSAQMCDVVEM